MLHLYDSYVQLQCSLVNSTIWHCHVYSSCEFGVELIGYHSFSLSVKQFQETFWKHVEWLKVYVRLHARIRASNRIQVQQIGRAHVMTHRNCIICNSVLYINHALVLIWSSYFPQQHISFLQHINSKTPFLPMLFKFICCAIN